MSHFRKILSTFISIVLIGWIVSRYDFSGIEGHFRWNWLIFVPLISCLGLLGLWIGSAQIYILLKFKNIETKLLDIFKFQLAATFYSIFAPSFLVAGGVTFYYLGKQTGKWGSVFASLGYVKILQFLLIALVSLIAVSLDAVSGIENFSLVLKLVSLVLLSALILVHLSIFEKFVAKFLKIKLVPSFLKNVLGKISESLFFIRSFTVKIILIEAMLSLILALISGIIFWAICLLVGISLPIVSNFWITGFLLFLTMLPVTFLGIGLREVSVLHILVTYYNVLPSQALLVSILQLVSGLLVAIVVGGVTALKVGGPLEALNKKKQQ